MAYLLKTEPNAYSFADLQRDGETVWDGVTNPTAVRNLRSMKPGDKLVIYSDGLTETENAEGEFFDSERLQIFLRDHAREGAAALHGSLLAAVDRFSEGGVVRDDVTLLVLEYASQQGAREG